MSQKKKRLPVFGDEIVSFRHDRLQVFVDHLPQVDAAAAQVTLGQKHATQQQFVGRGALVDQEHAENRMVENVT